MITVVGARPNFIKAAMVSQALGAIQGVEEIIVHTDQHYDPEMSERFFAELGIPSPKYHLNVGPGLQGEQTGKMLGGIEKVLLDEKPNSVVVYGDTNSTLAGALAAVKLHIPVVHIEAGLRSFNRRMPEEINRIMVDHISTLLLTPTDSAAALLRKEGIENEKIHVVGDVMYDSAIHFGNLAEKQSTILKDVGADTGNYALVTIHRAENTNSKERLKIIFDGLFEIAKEMKIFLPLHPRTKKLLGEYSLLDSVVNHLHILNPLGYLDIQMLQKHAKLVVTDSGGMQKEAFFHRVPCVTLRDETEWVELVELGWNHLVPPLSTKQIVQGFRSAIGSKGREAEPYGSPNSSERIARLIVGLK